MKLSEYTRLCEKLHKLLQQHGHYKYSLLTYDSYPYKWTELLNRCPKDWTEVIERHYDNHVYLNEFFENYYGKKNNSRKSNKL